MYFYFAYGLNIASELELPLELIDASSSTDVCIKVCDNIQYRALNHTHDGVGYTLHEDYVFLHWERVGSYLIKNGKDIWFKPNYETFTEQIYSVSLLNTVMAVLLFQRGRMILHGSSVKIGDKAHVFVGGKGFGKSTLATCLRETGYSLLSDDVCSIVSHKSECKLYPSFPQVKLWPDAMKYLKYDPQEHKRVFSFTDKRVVTSNIEFSTTPVQLGAIILLSFGDSIRLDPITGYRSIETLFPHCLLNRFYKGQSVTLVKKMYMQLTTIVKNVHVLLLTRPKDLQRIPEVVAKIDQQLTEKVL